MVKVDIYRAAIEKLAKWRSVLTGWQLGTRPDTDPESQAVRDQREAQLILRAEVSALTRLAPEKKLITQEELQRAIAEEAEFLCATLERKFPGFKATEYGMVIDIAQAQKTMQGWRP